MAVAVSIALHGTILYALSQMEMEMPIPSEKKRPLGRVVWLSDWPAPERTIPPEFPNADEEESRASEAPIAVQPQATPEEPESQAMPTAPPQTGIEDRQASDKPAPTENSRTPERRNTPVDEFGNPVNFQELQKNAVANVVSRLNRQSNFVTFSQGDSLAIAPLSGPPADMSVFDAPDSPRASLLSPNKARSKAGRWIGELCNALTGGFGIIGTGITVCAGGEIYGKMFAHLKPDYMRKRPVCVDTATGSADILAASTEQEFSTVKCRLVDMDEWGLIDLDRAAEEAALARE
jgi:hypothetical protein